MILFKKIHLGVILSILLSAIYFKGFSSTYFPRKECYEDLINNKSTCVLLCPNESFALPGMLSCHPWLKCSTKLTLISTLSYSIVKSIYLVSWNGYKIVLSVLTSSEYKQDFKHNIFMLKSLSIYPYVINLIGYCNNSFLTTYHEFGSALNVNYHLSHSLSSLDSIKFRLNLCINYASIIDFLHSSPVGIRVMCDSNTLEKTLSQFLLTNNFKIILNDLDATPEVKYISRHGIHCGLKQLFGNFVAPEQLWPYPNKIYDPKEMPYYNEKTDIWKIPDVCVWFLGNNSNVEIVKYKLFNLHKKCKDKNPLKRPTASEIVKKYISVLNEFN